MTRVIHSVVIQHSEETTVLFNIRDDQVHSKHVALRHVRRVDDRLAAHFDGCVVGEADGLKLLLERLVDPSPASLFAVAVVALEEQDRTTFDRCVAVAEAMPETLPGLICAFGWVSRSRLTGIGRDLLTDSSPFRRRLGLAACRVHRVDPGPALVAGLRNADPGVRGEALRTAGEIGRQDLLTPLIEAVQDADQNCQFWGARSLVLLGDRARALAVLARTGLADGPHRARAFRLALQAMSVEKGHALLQHFAADAGQRRVLIEGSGIVGEASYLPWLIKQMGDRKTMRLAGEAFTMIGGADLARLDLGQRPPENFESGPNDNPEDENVEMDPDEGLPWPDQQKVQRWWDAHGSAFQPGVRYFMGAPVTREHCIEVLKNGYQRQRILAAHYLCLLEPGTPLFNTSAPAWRQQRLLAQMA